MAKLQKIKKHELFGGSGSSAAEDENARLTAEVEEMIGLIETDIDKLRALYEMYFMGIERTEPKVQRDQARAKLRKYRDIRTKNTGLKFKIQTMQARFISLENYWGRIIRQREAGTYKRDRVHVQRRMAKHAADERQRELEDMMRKGRSKEPEGSAQTVAEQPAVHEGQQVPLNEGDREATRLPRRPGHRAGTSANRPSARSVEDLTEPKLRQLYSAYATAKKRCGEKLELGFNDMARSLKKQVPQLLKTTGAKEIEFKVVIKKGHAVLKAVPKR